MSFFGNHEIILIKEYEKLEGEYDEKKCFSGIFRVCYLLYWLERCCILSMIGLAVVLGGAGCCQRKHMGAFKTGLLPLSSSVLLSIFFTEGISGDSYLQRFFLADRHGFHCRGLFIPIRESLETIFWYSDILTFVIGGCSGLLVCLLSIEKSAIYGYK